MARLATCGPLRRGYAPGRKSGRAPPPIGLPGTTPPLSQPPSCLAPQPWGAGAWGARPERRAARDGAGHPAAGEDSPDPSCARAEQPSSPAPIHPGLLTPHMPASLIRITSPATPWRPRRVRRKRLPRRPTAQPTTQRGVERRVHRSTPRPPNQHPNGASAVTTRPTPRPTTNQHHAGTMPAGYVQHGPAVTPSHRCRKQRIRRLRPRRPTNSDATKEASEVASHTQSIRSIQSILSKTFPCPPTLSPLTLSGP